MPEFEGSWEGMEPIWKNYLDRRSTPDMPTRGFYLFDADTGKVVGSSKTGGIINTTARQDAESHFGDSLTGAQFAMIDRKPYRPEHDMVRGVKVPRLVNGGHG